MSFGQTDPADPGSWQQGPPSSGGGVEPADVQPAQPPPPVVTSPPGQPPSGPVTPQSVYEIARSSLPDDAALADFVQWSQSALPNLANQVLAASGVSQSSFDTAMNAWRAAVDQAEASMNAKSPPAQQPSPARRWAPLPGVGADQQCRSLFDANDLALRGRKAVLTKSYFVPVLYHQMLLNPAQKWAFGQKLEYRQEWRHEGFTLGELISSLSLLPNEELTLEVSSWQRTRSEIQQEETAEDRSRLEREQRRQDEESVATEAAASNGWSLSGTGTLNYGPVTASMSASVSGNTADRAERAQRHITEATTRATHEVSLRRAIKITQTSEIGSEQKTARRIRNPNSCHTVTFNFFQIVKLYDLQLRLHNDAPMILLPSLFPPYYTPPEGAPEGATGGPVQIPFWAVEAFASPAIFLTQFFDVDRELSREINGWALRVRVDAGRSPAGALAQVAQALVVAVKYLLRLDPAAHVNPVGAFVASYAANARVMRERSAAAYGVGKGRSEQVTTPGIYVDSMLGRCTACEESVEASRYADVMAQWETAQRTRVERDLLLVERLRRRLRLRAGNLEPFEPAAVETAVEE